MKLPANWYWSKLSEVCEKPEYGYTTSAAFDGEGPLLLRTTDITNGIINWQSVPFCAIPPDDESRYILRDGDILVTRAGSVGASIVIKNPPRAIFASYLIRFRPKKELYPPYAGFFLKSNIFWQQLGAKTSGTTLPGVNATNLAKVHIPLPPLPIQRKIATILERCEFAMRKRTEANRLSDELLKSTFLEMFGDPAKNPKKWVVKRFGDIYSSIRYGTGSPPEYQEKGTPFIRATNIKNGTVISSDMKFISRDDGANIEKCKVSYGNLIIVRSGVNAGDCALIPQEYDGAYAAYDLIVELPYHSAVFYNHLINSTYGKTMIAPMKRRAGQPHLNAEQIGSLRFVNPPSLEQQKFADIVQKVEKLKQKQHASEKELTNFFNSLMQKAFRGEL
jgi:type I restriction enzyme S subunit